MINLEFTKACPSATSLLNIALKRGGQPWQAFKEGSDGAVQLPYKHKHAPAFSWHASHSKTPAAAHYTGSTGRIQLTAVLAHPPLETASPTSSMLSLPEVMPWPSAKARSRRLCVWLWLWAAQGGWAWAPRRTQLSPLVPGACRRERARWQGAWPSGLPPTAAPVLWCGTAQAAGMASAGQAGLRTGARVLECQRDRLPGVGSHRPFAQREGPARPSLQHPPPLGNIGNGPTTSNGWFSGPRVAWWCTDFSCPEMFQHFRLWQWLQWYLKTHVVPLLITLDKWNISI